MKRVLFFAVALCLSASTFAEDIIITKSAERLVVNIVGVSMQEIKYKLADGSSGNTTLVMPTSDINSIIFENGYVQLFKEEENVDEKKIELLSNVRSANAQYVNRYGNRYFYGDRMMRGQEYMNFLENNCRPAYEQYRKGYVVSSVGWVLFGVGVGLDFLSALSPYCVIPASALEVSSITMLIVGYCQMHRSAEVFNTQCTHGKVQSYWSVNASRDGVGLALNF